MEPQLVTCVKCHKAFRPLSSEWRFVVNVANSRKPETVLYLECTTCHKTTPVIPGEVMAGKSGIPNAPLEPDPLYRCPVQGCTGLVVHVTKGRESFWGCGMCGTRWQSLNELFRDVEAILLQFPHRKRAHKRLKESGFAPIDAASDDNGIERVIESELTSPVPTRAKNRAKSTSRIASKRSKGASSKRKTGKNSKRKTGKK